MTNRPAAPRSRRPIRALAALPLLLSMLAAAAPATQPGPAQGGAVDVSVQLPDADGAARRPLEAAEAAGAGAVVFLFIATDCPISNAYAPEVNRICSRYGKEGKNDGDRRFAFYLVHADPDVSAADAKKHASDYGYTCPVLIDAKKRLAAALGAKATPQAVVVSPDGKVLYRGRIDDLYAGYGKRRAEATTHDLRDALDAVAAGKPVAVPETPVVGCPIE